MAALLREFGDCVGQPGDLAARSILMDHVLLRGSHQLRLRFLQRCDGGGAVALLDRFLDAAHRTAHTGAARLVDGGAASDLAGRLAG